MRELRLKAEINEYIYYKLKENGVSQAIDEDIGNEFFFFEDSSLPAAPAPKLSTYFDAISEAYSCTGGNHVSSDSEALMNEIAFKEIERQSEIFRNLNTEGSQNE